ncbi:MAG TPA: TerC/Alx family metal homeostasis membrane protein [Thermoanaerobaculia bacterium]|nr:TerC/Alx family metal homeostasis membrane protein [Thermoanaerobaculia bacterium]HQR66352.1 TerC/Alx family metal homeostasis membrane protein [Thermoanaerobaculia bacterium]
MTPNVTLFPFAEYWWVYGLFLLVVLAMLALDLGVFHRKAHAVSFREAAAWSVVWVVLALAVGAAIWKYGAWRFPQVPRLTSLPGFVPEAAAWQTFLEYLTGYVVEKSLSVDNVFIFVVVFGFFAIPAELQHRVLFWGILGALVFRAIFIALGAALMQFHWVLWLFGGFLVLTGLKILIAPDKPIDPAKNPVVRLVKRLVPVTHELKGASFFVRDAGRIAATPLFLALVFIEVTDVIFAIDSVPAIFAITDEPLIVFTSNICAILGLRAMFFMLAGAVGKFHLLKYGLGTVLVFVGLKMAWLNDAFGGKFPVTWSLGIIAVLIGGAIGASLLFPKAARKATG